jgi:phosphoribosylformylglycinamidine synthase
MIGPGPRLGANLAPPGDLRSDALLFGESAARIVVSVRREHVQGLRAVAQRQGVARAALGMAGGDHLTLQGRGFRLHLPVEAIYWAWGTGLSRSLK